MGKNNVHAGARLDRLPISPFHRRILWLIGSGMFLDLFDIYLAGGVLTTLLKSGWSTVQLNATFISMTLCGMLLGTCVAGILGDLRGRRFAYQFNLIIFGLASAGGALAPNMLWLIVCRFFMGLGLGAEIVIGYGYISEFIPPAVRGRWLAYLCLITNASLFFSTFLSYLIIPTLGWRALFAIVGIGALIIMICRKKMPESPRWLESKGRYEEAEAVLRMIEAESAQNQTLMPVEKSTSVRPRAISFFALFQGPQLRRMLLSICIHVGINAVVYGFIVWVPTFLMKQGLTVVTSLGYTVLMSLGGPTGAFLGVLISDKVGRKNGLIGAAILAAAVGWLYGHSTNPAMATVLGFAIFTLTYLMLALGFAGYVPELFATENRMRANSIANGAGRIVAILMPQLVVVLFAKGGLQAVLFPIICSFIVMALALALFGIETNQRSLEDITLEGQKNFTA